MVSRFVALTTEEAADILGVKPRLLSKWRNEKRPEDQPPFTKVGNLVRYYQHHLEAWIEKQTRGL